MSEQEASLRARGALHRATEAAAMNDYSVPIQGCGIVFDAQSGRHFTGQVSADVRAYRAEIIDVADVRTIDPSQPLLDHVTSFVPATGEVTTIICDGRSAQELTGVKDLQDDILLVSGSVILDVRVSG